MAARVGILDRKLRVVGEHARSRAEWARAGLATLKATFGYEYQGDNLLIARINVLETFAEHFEGRWGDPVGRELVSEAAEIVSWNLWQMDGLSATAPTNAEDARLAAASLALASPAFAPDAEEQPQSSSGTKRTRAGPHHAPLVAALRDEGRPRLHGM